MRTARADQTPRDAGFTLLELLVALTLMGLLSVVLFSGLHFGRRVWEASERTTESANRIRSFQQDLAEDLTRAYPEVVATTDPTKAHIDFQGAPERISFLAPDRQVRGQLDRVTIRMTSANNGGQLVEDVRPELASHPVDTHVKPHLPQVAALRFSYYGSSKKDDPPAWHPSWSGEMKLPRFIRVDLRFVGPRDIWPEFIVAPLIAADVSCTFDALTHNCQGR